MSGTYPDIAANNNKTFSGAHFFRVYINLNVRIGWIGIGIFYPLGEPTLLHLLCCDPVVTHLRWTTTAAWVTPRICSNLGP
jgi:hypothetical protein